VCGARDLLHCHMASDPNQSDGANPEASAKRFKETLRRVLTVSKDELTKREAAYKKARAKIKSRLKPAASR
jgi:hypothetical protein